jgi:protoheme IX farnesyltransferase
MSLDGSVYLGISPHPNTATLPDSVSLLAFIKERSRAYWELMKPRIVLMVLLTVGIGFVLGAQAGSHPTTLSLTLIGAGLVAAGSSGWNQILERPRDALMRRTSRRPLPSGRLGVTEAVVFSTILTIAGLGLLLWGTNRLATALTAITFASYIGLYTPLKVRTTLNTAIGAVPGALPPMIGWAAATNRLGMEAWALFLILFLWQFPHFLAIAWIHRADYARGGYQMLPLMDPSGLLTARQATWCALALIPASLMASVVGLAGIWYFLGALLLGIGYLTAAIRFWIAVSEASARRLMLWSFLYLPSVLVLLLLDPLPA